MAGLAGATTEKTRHVVQEILAETGWADELSAANAARPPAPEPAEPPHSAEPKRISQTIVATAAPDGPAPPTMAPPASIAAPAAPPAAVANNDPAEEADDAPNVATDMLGSVLAEAVISSMDTGDAYEREEAAKVSQDSSSTERAPIVAEPVEREEPAPKRPRGGKRMWCTVCGRHVELHTRETLLEASRRS